MSNLITGLFDTVSAAENAVDLLKQRGYSENEISIIMRNREEAQEVADHSGASTMSGIGAGAAIGGTLGAVLGGLLAVGTIALPGIGLLLGGTAAAALAGAGAGGIAGSIVGWLVNLGIDDEVAPYYERTLNEGGIVVAVACHPDDDNAVRLILEGESVAVAGKGLPTYMEPSFASRYSDLTTPASSMGYAPLNQAAVQAAPAVPRATFDDIPVPSQTQIPNITNADLTTFPTQENPRVSTQSDTVPYEGNRGAGTMPKAYDSTMNDSQTTMATTTPEVSRTVNSVNAEERSAERTAETRERNAEREANDDGILDDMKTAVVNTTDNTRTALQNQADKVGTGVQNTEDRLSRP